MSQPIPERADVRQLRIQAKELLRSLQSADPQALALDPRLDPASVKLSDAQRLVARKHGYSSWPKLVDEVETPVLIKRMTQLIEAGKADELEKLLETKPVLKKHLNDPLFSFDSPAVVHASHHRDAARLLPVLVANGADPNARSTWWAGSFGALDHAQEETVEVLLGLGTRWDVWSAAGHGKVDILRELLDADPSLVNAPGGDGERPLHFAKTVEIAELLIERGADLEIRDVDHESTPAQYQISSEAVLRVLIEHGAKPDVFTAAVLNNVEMLKALLAEDPSATSVRVGMEPFVTHQSEGGHIYAYRIGNGKTPQIVAAERGNREVLEELNRHGASSQSLVSAAWMNDAATVEKLKGVPIAPEDAIAITSAAQDGRTETVRLLLEAGFDPMTPGMDSGTALHVACWFGYVEVVKLLIGHVPLDTRDAHHGSTPLGWACHGAQWCGNGKGDYVAVVESLLEAGADVGAVANSGGTSILDQAGDREDVKAVLRRYGAA